VLDVNVFDATVVGDEDVQQKTEAAQQQGTDHGRPEALDVKAGDDGRSQLQHGAVDHEGEDPEAEQVDREGNDQQALRMPSTSAATRSAPTPSTWMPLITPLVSHRARALMIHRIRAPCIVAAI